MSNDKTLVTVKHGGCVQLGDGLLRNRTPTDYAIEHAGYLATAAQRLLDARGELDALVMRREEEDDVDDGDMHAAQECVDEASTGVRSAIYDFEKRRDRALSAQPSPGAVHSAVIPDTLVNGGALKMALNVLRRAGKNEVADELESTAAIQPSPGGQELEAGDDR